MIKEQSKLDNLSEVLSNIAHQWRQPLSELSSILMEIQTASKFDKLDKPYLERSIKDCNILMEHMSKTIDDFANFFKPDKKMEKFCVNDSLDYVLYIMHNSLEAKHIILHKDFCDDIFIIGFKREFEQVILNILKNSLEVFDARQIQHPIIKINIDIINHEVVIKIADNGGGVPDDIKDKIFDPYFSTKSQKTNSGIGLYMSKMLIEHNMSGTLFFENTQDGVVFTITFKEFA